MRHTAALLALLAAAAPCAAESVLFNPTKRDCRDELIRLAEPAPGPAGTFVVREDGAEVPYQVETIDGRPRVWVCSDFAPGARKKYELRPGKPRPTAARVTVRRQDDGYLLDNGVIAVKLPARAGDGRPGPVVALRLPDGRWVGGSFWKTDRKLTRFSAEVVGDGTLFGKVRLRYDFDGKAGLDNDVPAFAEVDVTLGPGWRHIELFERHEMGRGDNWEFEASKGWKPTHGLSRPFTGGLGGPPPDPARPLKPIEHQAFRPDLYVTLRPRWNQNYADGWAFCATDGESHAGAVAVRASRWDWPHQNALECVVSPAGDYAGVRCPTWKGERLWWLIASQEPAGVCYVARYAWEHLDKLNHEMILDWPGQPGNYSGLNLYDNQTVNPTSLVRQFNKRALADAGKPGNYATLSLQQTLMHEDAYGSSWRHWSPCNPNFFTDFNTRPIVLASNLKAHPHYDDIRKAAALRLREDLYHSVTLPGGAGQECPGYEDYALKRWKELAAVCRDQLGIDDPFVRQRIAAAESFNRRISQPDGAVRRRLPVGDTHNARDGGPVVEDVPPDEVARWTTTELPGFGVVFNSRPGTAKETYLSFKSGPNRGHYHGDQLAFHFCADARPLVVDHHCSYHPRAGQDHMHNRLAFFTDDMPYANTGGYERLIAFKTSPAVDVAVGQVESSLLTAADAYPPERWRPQFPVKELTGPLVYRRTVVFVKGGEHDYVVFRDQFWAPEPLHAAFCLHALDDDTIAVRSTTGVADGSNVFRDAGRDFSALRVAPGSRLLVFRNGYRNGDERPKVYEVREAGKDGLTLTAAPPAGKGLTYAVLRDLVRRDGRTVTLGKVTLFCAGPGEPALGVHPWFHENGGLEQTQGVRLETSGRQGEYVTVLYPGRLPAASVIAGGVRVGGDEIVFGGDRPTAGDAAVQVMVRREGKEVLRLTGKDIDMERSQGDVGLCVPDASAPHGDVPDWLIRQRGRRPDWAK